MPVNFRVEKGAPISMIAHVEDKGYKYRVLMDDFFYIYDDAEYIIPVQFLWDAGSIPNALSSFLVSGYDPRIEIPALVHDASYRFGYLSKKESDKLFYEMCRFYGISRIKSKTMYTGLKMFGHKAYDTWEQMRMVNPKIFLRWQLEGLNYQNQEYLLATHARGGFQ